MLIFNYFLRRYMRITGAHVYIVNIQNNEDHGIWSSTSSQKKFKKLVKQWKLA